MSDKTRRKKSNASKLKPFLLFRIAFSQKVAAENIKSRNFSRLVEIRLK